MLLGTSANGYEFPVRVDAGLFQEVIMPKGDSRLTFSFEPPYIGIAFFAFGVGLIALVAAAVVSSRGSTACLRSVGLAASAAGPTEWQPRKTPALASVACRILSFRLGLAVSAPLLEKSPPTTCIGQYESNRSHA